MPEFRPGKSDRPNGASSKRHELLLELRSGAGASQIAVEGPSAMVLDLVVIVMPAAQSHLHGGDRDEQCRWPARETIRN